MRKSSNKNREKDSGKRTEETQTDSQSLIETEISIPAGWNVSNEERYVYAFHNNESPKLKPNQLSIYGMELIKEKNRTTVTGLIRNTVAKEVQFGATSILLLDSKHEVLARKEFDLSALGRIPQNGARPWKFVFAKEDFVQGAEMPGVGWSLAFELKSKHQLELEESWEESIADQTKASLEKIVEQAPDLKPGEVNFMGIQAKQNENQDLSVTILIRNGTEKNITLEQLPLGVKDASGEEIARGSFTLDHFTVSANTSKPWTFIFPAASVTTENPDFTKWQVYPIK